MTSSDVSLSFLPLSHILQRHVDYASLYAGTTIVYAESVTSVAEDMMEVRPTFCAGVPRFFEKVYVRIRSEAGRATLVRRAIFEKAVQIGKDALRKGRSSLAYRAADRAVFQQLIRVSRWPPRPRAGATARAGRGPDLARAQESP